MIKYPLDYNPIIEYWKLIESGAEVVSDKVRRVYKQLVFNLTDGNSEWEYNPKKANHIIEFIENYCKHSKGKLGGKPFILELWQKAMLASAFGFVHKIDGTRKYREVLLIVARKNGKSTLAAAVGLYLQIADGEPGSEIFAVATKKDQAKIIWLEAKRMVKKSPVLLKRIKPLVAEMVAEFNDSFFKPLGSDSDTLDGLNVHGALLDEIHAWKDKNLYDVIVDGTTAREQPLIFITTTAGTIRESVYDLKCDEAVNIINGYNDPNGYKDERILPIIYELDKREEYLDPKCFKKANPGIGTIKSLDQLQSKVNKAKSNPLLAKNLLCKDFNIRQTTSEAFLTWEQLNNQETFNLEELKPRYCIAGIDLGSTTDLTCSTIIFRVPNDEILYVKQMYFLPSDLIEKRTKEDKIPYDVWSEQGLLRLSGTNKVNYKDVSDWLLEVQNEMDIYIYKIGYDSWGSTYLVDELQSLFGRESTEPVIQGAKTFSNPLKRVASELEAKKINYDNNPVFKWCLANSAVSVDRNDNYALIKTSKSRRRIDGFASFMDAYIVYEKHYDNYISLI